MYISNMTHFLDETGNIPKQMPKEAREIASFLALVIDVTTLSHASTLTLTNIRCFQKGCSGMVKTKFGLANREINWYCPNC
jgi:hypothetical protein